ncbi:MAG: NADH-quinone oxidoreductase subunit L [Acidobacteriota bacterium]|nr:NADH-quinone oxidoreductase subunit L [Acidobacteriota bacterium]
MRALDLLWLVPLLPLAGSALNALLGPRVARPLTTAVALGAPGLSLAISLMAVWTYATTVFPLPFEQVLYAWTTGELSIDVAFLLDPLSSVMVVVVTLVGFLIHVYSVGYMGDDSGYQRYFSYLNLFMGAMLLLVLGNNFLVMFVGWEGVGLCSYLLIGYYYEEEFPPYAGRKAFIVNRIGDFAFLVGLFALVARFGTLDYGEVFAAVASDPHGVEEPYLLGLSFAGFVTLCLFIGAIGKSAQLPLYVWLPDAMAGPTPVSALIHAATMVTAGVYMVVRTNVLYQLAPGTSALVATVGAVTALFAATIAFAQTDIKKVLAYSTVSQLGYMFLGAGVGAYSAAIFHLGTHAFFKALLFLGSGSVIHAMSGEQDMRRMGGLKKALPVTFATFAIATVAISGIPPLAGFFSKDQILAGAWGEHKVLWAIGLVTAGLTACYMFRALLMTFYGRFRGTDEVRSHLHESPTVMTLPLVVLAVGSALAGLIGIPKLGTLDINWFGHFLAPVVAPVGHAGEHGHHASLGLELLLMGVSVAAAVGGIWMAWRTYGGERGLAGGEAWAIRFPTAHRILTNKYYVDEIYDATVIKGTWSAARGLFRFDAGFIDGFLVNGSRHVTVAVSLLSGFFDKYVIDGVVNLSGWVMRACSRLFRSLQTGLVSQYALVVAVGMLVLTGFYLVVRLG